MKQLCHSHALTHNLIRLHAVQSVAEVKGLRSEVAETKLEKEQLHQKVKSTHLKVRRTAASLAARSTVTPAYARVRCLPSLVL